jgi:hypothetical protein
MFVLKWTQRFQNNSSTHSRRLHSNHLPSRFHSRLLKWNHLITQSSSLIARAILLFIFFSFPFISFRISFVWIGPAGREKKTRIAHQGTTRFLNFKCRFAIPIKYRMRGWRWTHECGAKFFYFIIFASSSSLPKASLTLFNQRTPDSIHLSSHLKHVCARNRIQQRKKCFSICRYVIESFACYCDDCFTYFLRLYESNWHSKSSFEVEREEVEM